MFTPIADDRDTRYLEPAFLLSNTPVLYCLEISIEWGAISLAVSLQSHSLNNVAPQLAPEGVQSWRLMQHKILAKQKSLIGGSSLSLESLR
jgi:hypothetical protein